MLAFRDCGLEEDWAARAAAPRLAALDRAAYAANLVLNGVFLSWAAASGSDDLPLLASLLGKDLLVSGGFMVLMSLAPRLYAQHRVPVALLIRLFR